MEHKDRKDIIQEQEENQNQEAVKTEAELDFEKKVQGLAKEIRLKSKKEILFTESMALKKPLEFSKEEVTDIFNGLQGEEYKDIALVAGAKCTYYYSTESMTESFAKTLSLITDKDLYRLFAEVIRKDSKVYKRTTNPNFFCEEPYKLTKLQINDIQNHIHLREEYADIKTVKASNNVVNFYSEKYLSQVYAKSLCEWQEVEIYQCP